MLHLEQLAWYFGLFLKAAVAWRLFSLGLLRRYPALACCMGFQLIRAVPLLTLDVNTNAYALTYFITLPLTLASYVWVALEIYSRAFENYRGLSAVSRGVVLGVLALSATLAVGTHLGELHSAGEPFQVLRAVLLIESSVYLTLLFFLTAVAAFLIWYPAAVRKNLLLYSFSVSIYMATQCAMIFLRNSDPNGMVRIASMVQLALDDLCLLAIVVFLRTAWEKEDRPKVASLTTEHAQRLLLQLSHLNASLENKPKHTPST